MSIPWDFLISIATPLSVFFLAYQLWLRKKQFTTEFEDKLTSDYREIVYEIPVESLLDDSDADQYEGCLKDYYRYIDLSNDQVFLRKEGRVSKSTWENWQAGIETNIQRNDFQKAWCEIKDKAPDSFNELRKLEDPTEPDDPLYWQHPYRARLQDIFYRIKF
jgi:hypothetical protein